MRNPRLARINKTVAISAAFAIMLALTLALVGYFTQGPAPQASGYIDPGDTTKWAEYWNMSR